MGNGENMTSVPGFLISDPRKTLFRTGWPGLLQLRAPLSNTSLVCFRQMPEIPL